MKSNLIPQFSQKMMHEDFLKYFTNCCRKRISSQRDMHQTTIFDNLMRNYLKFYEHYNNNNTLIGSLVYWSKKLKYNNPAVWEIFEKALKEKLHEFDGKSLIVISTSFKENTNFIKIIENYVTENMGKFDSRMLSQFSEILASDEFLLKLKENNKLIVSNELDLLYFFKSCTDDGILKELECHFQEILPKIKNMQAFCNILKEFNLRNYSVSQKTLELIENFLLDSKMRINLQDFNDLFMFFNHSTVYDRPSAMFWRGFNEKIMKALKTGDKKISSSKFLIVLSNSGLFVDEIYEKAVSNWQKELEKKLDSTYFREGFYGLCNSYYLSESLVQWSLTKFLLLTTFNDVDILQIARGLTIQNNYDPAFWDVLTEKMKFINPNSLGSKGKSIFFHIYKSVQIDNPPNANTILQGLISIYLEVLASYKENSNFTRSYSQQYIARTLKMYSYEFQENQYVSDFYEIDIVLKNSKIGIEVIGSPYHASQVNHKLFPKYKMKLRHLNKLGWKIILIRSKESALEHIKNMISFVNVIDTPISIDLVDGEIKIIT